MSITGMVISGSNTELRKGNTDVLIVLGSSVVNGMLVPTVSVSVGLPESCAPSPSTSSIPTRPTRRNRRRSSVAASTEPAPFVRSPRSSTNILERSRIYASAAERRALVKECAWLLRVFPGGRRAGRAGARLPSPCGCVRVSTGHGWRRSASCGPRDHTTD